MTEQLRLRWPVDGHTINQYFGENPDFYKPFGLPGHEGLDFYAPTDSNVYAAAAGRVYRVMNPPGHPYGLHIRLSHVVAGIEYQTIYAHLAQVFVLEGETVQAGQRIALADNSGNSFGSHLHLTLKAAGAQTPGYPPGIVDPLPYFQPSDLVLYTTTAVNLRPDPSTNSMPLAVLPQNTGLMALGDSAEARLQAGQPGGWIEVRTLAGLAGFVASQYLHYTGQVLPPASLTVYPTTDLSVRAQPSIDSNRLAVVPPGDPLTVLGDEASAQAAIGQMGQWVNIRTQAGFAGYVAAWLVTGQSPSPAGPPAGPPAPAPTTLIVYPTAGINLRAQPSVNSPRIGGASFNAPLTVVDDSPNPAGKVGQPDQWLYVEDAHGLRGWAAAWLLALNPS